MGLADLQMLELLDVRFWGLGSVFRFRVYNRILSLAVMCGFSYNYGIRSSNRLEVRLVILQASAVPTLKATSAAALAASGLLRVGIGTASPVPRMSLTSAPKIPKA